MKKITTIILAFTFAIVASGQTFEPQILILTPNDLKFEKSFEGELKAANKELSKISENRDKPIDVNSSEFKMQPENIKQMYLSETSFMEKLDFPKEASFFAEQYLSYRFYERFENLLILLSDKKSSGSPAELLKIAETEKMQYVLNFSRIELFKRDGISFAKVTVQLFDKISKTCLIISDYEGDWTNPGFEFACKEGSIRCAVNNALSKAFADVIFQIASNSPTIRRDRELAKLRFDKLIANYYSTHNDKEFLSSVIPQPDSNIVLSNQFQIIVDPTKTKFIAFFSEKDSANSLASLKNSRGDNSINILSGGDLNDMSFLDSKPRIYSFIVTGVFHEDKWYYEKLEVTYFEADDYEEGKKQYFYNLVRWNFFKENLDEFNPDFWESNFFAKVERSVDKNMDKIEEYRSKLAENKEPDYNEAYQMMINDFYEEDLKNKDYFGLYKIVADQLKKDKGKQYEKFSESIQSSFLPKFFDRYCKENNLSGYCKMNGKEIVAIFPGDTSIILVPIVLDYGNDKKELNFFVLIPKGEKSFTVYKWDYFDPIQPKSESMYGHDVNLQLNIITLWNFSFDTLDDPLFWENYVLVKSGENYKYLTLIQ